MVEFHGEDTISVFMEHEESNSLTRATLDWEQPPVTDSYTIAPHDVVSIAFDKHFPIRPAEVAWHIKRHHGQKTLEHLFGEEFTEGMLQARKLGFLSIAYNLDDRNRKSLAKLQFNSPSTPTPIKELCRSIIGSEIPRRAA